MIRFLVRLAVPGLAALILCPGMAWAWGWEGHEAIGLLAERQIAGTRAAAEVGKLLRAGETLAVAATWADRIKRGGFDAESLDFILRNPAHPTYHYTDIPFQALEYRPNMVGARPLDLVHLYGRCIAILRGRSDAKSNPTEITPRVALLLVAHFAGDIEQPFHVGGGYIGERDGAPYFVDPRQRASGSYRSDIGANALMIGPGNLHFYWDVLAVQRAMARRSGATGTRAYAEWSLATIKPRADWNAKGDPASWPAQWAGSALPLAREARAGLRLGPRVEVPNPNAPPPFRSEWTVALPPDYERLALDAVDLQIARGGYRLAQLLQAIWP